MGSPANSGLGPPPLNTPIGSTGADQFGVPFENRPAQPLPAANIAVTWGQWFNQLFQILKTAVLGASALTTVNVIPKVTAPGILGNSSLTDNGTNVSTSESLLVGSATDDGSGALLQVHGNVNLPTGSTYQINGVAIGATGFPGSYVPAVALTGQTAGIGTTNLQHASAVLPSGDYLVCFGMECTATGTGTVDLTIGWTSPSGRAHAQVVAIVLNSLGTVISQAMPIHTDGANNLTYSTTDSGTGTYSLDITVVRTN